MVFKYFFISINLLGNMAQVSIQEGIDFLKNECFIPLDQLESNHHYIYNSGQQRNIGPKSYPKNFIPPIGWTAIALKVGHKYGNNTWIGNSNVDGEWYVGYHGVKTKESINNIFYRGFRKGPGQDYKNYDNINPLSNITYPKCKEGVYFAQNIDDAKSYCNIIQSNNGNKYRIVFMCRINPYEVRISNIGINRDFMVVNGDELNDTYGSMKTNEVRPYKILLLKE